MVFGGALASASLVAIWLSHSIGRASAFAHAYACQQGAGRAMRQEAGRPVLPAAACMALRTSVLQHAVACSHSRVRTMSGLALIAAGLSTPD